MAERRPLKSRATAWAASVTDLALRLGLSPNQISLLSILFAGIGAYALLHPAQPLALLAAALCIQLRLLCNLIDGMVAIEGGQATPTGALYNEIPDRIADSLLLVAAGYAAAVPAMGWLAALLAAITAYVRTLGGSLGLAQDFRGLQAKPQRMALLTVACLLAMIESLLAPGDVYFLQLGLAIIIIGTGWTVLARMRAIAAALEDGA
jgi:phosphatidylglycerophosphate synthase